MAAKDEVPIPEIAKNDSESFEVLRVWVAKGGQHVSLRAGIWEDPAAWGIMLADLARHITNAYVQSEGRDAHETLERIRAGIEVELDSPTDTASGELI